MPVRQIFGPELPKDANPRRAQSNRVILKRLLADVNLLLGEFRLFGSKFPASRAKTDFHFEHVIVLREKMLTLLEKYRSGKNEK